MRKHKSGPRDIFAEIFHSADPQVIPYSQKRDNNLALLERAEWSLRNRPALSPEDAELLEDICTALADAEGRS
jgi:hypothetical protein